jgi:hypothetical protein
MAAATAQSASAFRFTPALLAVMEPHVQKARALRAERAALGVAAEARVRGRRKREGGREERGVEAEGRHGGGA